MNHGKRAKQPGARLRGKRLGEVKQDARVCRPAGAHGQDRLVAGLFARNRGFTRGEPCQRMEPITGEREARHEVTQRIAAREMCELVSEYEVTVLGAP